MPDHACWRVQVVAVLPLVCAASLFSACGHRRPLTRTSVPEMRTCSAADGYRLSVIETLRTRGAATHTSGMYLSVNGLRVIDERFDSSIAPIDLMSATKGIVALGVASLIREGHLRTIDVPMQDLASPTTFDAQPILLRHVLAHVSGLGAARTTEEIYAAPDFQEFARGLPRASAPNTRFFYNNAAVNLIAPIFLASAGQRMDAYIAEHVLHPAGVRQSLWLTDAFLWHLRQTGRQDTAMLQRGNPVAMAHLFLTPHDVGLVGELLLSELRAAEPRFFSRNVLEELQRPGQRFDASSSLLWWLVRDASIPSLVFDARQRAALPRTGLPDGMAEELSALDGRYANPAEFSRRLDSLPTVRRMGGRLPMRLKLIELGFSDPLLRVLPTRVVGIAARGTYGQYLVVIPSAGVVGVRMIDSERWTGPDDDFSDFEYLVAKLADQAEVGSTRHGGPDCARPSEHDA